MDPVTYHLPAKDGANPASIIDCGGASLRECLDYGARLYGWKNLLLPLTESLEPVPLEEVDEELLDIAALDKYDEIILPEGCTVRRILTHAVVLAVITDEQGNHLAEAAEIRALAGNHVDAMTTIATPESGWGDEDEDEDGDWDDGDEDWDEDEEDEEDEEEDGDEDDEELDEKFPVD